MKNSNTQNGVTLIELMIVLAVLSIISAVAIPAYTGYIQESKKTECFNEVAKIRLAQEEFAINNNGNYFDTAANSQGLYTAPDLANCNVTITLADPATSYSITITGDNDLPDTFTKTYTIE